MKKPELSWQLQSYLVELGADAAALLESYTKSLPDSIRVNTLNVNEAVVRESLERQGFILQKIPWAKFGYFVELNKTKLSETGEFKNGSIYVQGPVSMAIPEVLSPKPGDKVLDMCAAPGSKSTQILQALGGTGELVANESVRNRIKTLENNLQLCGAANYIITNGDGRGLHRRFAGQFDRVLIDAPCSGLGIASKDWTIARDWKLIRSKRLAKVQTGLLLSGYKCLKLGGILVYSTCTFTVEENELVVNKLLKKTSAEIVKMELPGLAARHGITAWKGKKLDSSLSGCLRIYPYDSGAEGFFVAKLRKAK